MIYEEDFNDTLSVRQHTSETVGNENSYGYL